MNLDLCRTSSGMIACDHDDSRAGNSSTSILASDLWKLEKITSEDLF